MQESGLPEVIPHMHLSCLGPGSRVFTPEFLSAHRGEWLPSDRCQIMGILFLLGALGAQKFPFGGLELMMTVTCFFTDNGRIYFNSQNHM